MAFKLVLSPELREKIDAEAREIERIYGLPDRWLAEELLRLVRAVRSRTEYASRRPDSDTYNSTLLWDVIPEVARRLGGRLGLNESADADIRRSEGEAFRNFVSICITNVSTGYLSEASRGELLDPVSILFHSFYNGNPVAIALDRVVPPAPDSGDFLAKEMFTVSERRGHEPAPSWRPEFQETPARQFGVALSM